MIGEDEEAAFVGGEDEAEFSEHRDFIDFHVEFEGVKSVERSDSSFAF